MQLATSSITHTHTKFRLSMCDFWTRNGLHGNCAISQKWIPRICFCLYVMLLRGEVYCGKWWEASEHSTWTRVQNPDRNCSCCLTLCVTLERTPSCASWRASRTLRYSEFTRAYAHGARFFPQVLLPAACLVAGQHHEHLIWPCQTSREPTLQMVSSVSSVTGNVECLHVAVQTVSLRDCALQPIPWSQKGHLDVYVELWQTSTQVVALQEIYECSGQLRETALVHQQIVEYQSQTIPDIVEFTIASHFLWWKSNQYQRNFRINRFPLTTLIAQIFTGKPRVGTLFASLVHRLTASFGKKRSLADKRHLGSWPSNTDSLRFALSMFQTPFSPTTVQRTDSRSMFGLRVLQHEFVP